MSISDETLSAYVAGTLSAKARARVDAALAVDPALAERLRRHVTVKGIVQSAYGSLSEQPRRASSSEGDRRRPAQVVQLAAVREARKPPQPPPTWRRAHFAALGLALAAGVAIGWFLDPAAAPVIGNGANGLVAQGALAQALSTQASQPPGADHGRVLVFQTFRAGDGAWCRSFRAESAPPKDGIACRRGGDWMIRMMTMAPGTAAPASALQTVAGEMRSGDALTPAQETERLRQRWR